MGFQFAGKAVYSAVWVAAVSLFMELLGFSTQKWLTAGGLGTVLITLAGREVKPDSHFDLWVLRNIHCSLDVSFPFLCKRDFIETDSCLFQILTNFLSSVMIHATRPFVLNEWIQTKIEGYEVSGTVEVSIIISQLRFCDFFS